MTAIWCRPASLSSRSPLLSRLANGFSLADGRDVQTYQDLVRRIDELDEPVVFVIDDVDSRAEPDVEADLERFLLDTSLQVRILVSSRRRLSFNLARSEMPAAVILSTEDFRFRTYEVEQLFRTVYREPLNGSGIQNLARRTDGWAACLHLFHLSVSGRHTVDQRRAAEALGDRLAFAADYLDHQVLGVLHQELRDLLTATSLYDVLTPRLCDEVRRTDNSRGLLHRVEEVGLLEREGDTDVYRLTPVLRHHLRHSLEVSATYAGWPEHCAAAAEKAGHVGEALRIRAESGDWTGVSRTLARARTSAIVQGECAWSSAAPDDVLAQPWPGLAEARRLLDDGALAASAEAAARVLDAATDPSCRKEAMRIRDQASAWSGAAAPNAGDAFAALHAATRRCPGDVGRRLLEAQQPEPLLAAALSFLLAGDQRTALPLLRRCAEALDRSPFVALSAQLVLIVIGATPDSQHTVEAADELDGVRREAEKRGYSWLARLASGLGATSIASGRPQPERAAASCDERGDDWGAALLLAAAAIGDLVGGRLDPQRLDSLSDRFRALGAAVPEAWARAAHAIGAAVADEPDARETALAAVSFARMASVPGAAALGYAALAMQDGDRYRELMLLARDTARDAGFLSRPWMRFRPPAPASATRGHEARAASLEGARRGIEVRCLGGFSVRSGGADVDLSRIRPQARTVLRILALHRGQPVHRGILTEALWPDLGTRGAQHALQVSVSSLRRVLESEVLEGGVRVGRAGQAYTLALDPDTTLDLVEFDAALHDAWLARSAREAAEEVVALRRAVEIYTGDLLPEDGSADWVIDARDMYRLRAGEAASTLARLEFELGNRAPAEAAALRSIEIDPYRDESWRILIGVYRRSGNVVAAQRAEQRYRSVLATLGVADSGRYSTAEPALSQPGTRLPQWPAESDHRRMR